MAAWHWFSLHKGYSCITCWKTQLDKLAFSAKPEIRLELELEHRNISQIRLELD